jgi:hypothetical protein
VSTFSIALGGLPGRCPCCGHDAGRFPLAVAPGGRVVVQCPQCFARLGGVTAVPAEPPGRPGDMPL